MSKFDPVSALRSAGLRLQAGKSGKIRTATLEAGKSLSDDQWQLLAHLTDLVRFEAPDAMVTDRQVSILARLPRIAQLNLRGTSVSDDALEDLKKAQTLQLLDLAGTHISADGLKMLRQTLLGTRIVM